MMTSVTSSSSLGKQWKIQKKKKKLKNNQLVRTESVSSSGHGSLTGKENRSRRDGGLGRAHIHRLLGDRRLSPSDAGGRRHGGGRKPLGDKGSLVCPGRQSRPLERALGIRERAGIPAARGSIGECLTIEKPSNSIEREWSGGRQGQAHK